MSEPSEKQLPHRLILEIRAGKSVLICQRCDRPILEIVDGELTIESRHASDRHKNVLTVEYLQMLVFEMRRQTNPSMNW